MSECYCFAAFFRKNTCPTPSQMAQVKLNVGGTVFVTARSTLQPYPGTYFDSLLKQCEESAPGETVFVDRDADRFRLILNFLRDGPAATLLPDHAGLISELRQEARFFQLSALQTLLDAKLAQCLLQATPRSKDHHGHPAGMSTDESLMYPSECSNGSRNVLTGVSQDSRCSTAVGKVTSTIDCSITSSNWTRMGSGSGQKIVEYDARSESCPRKLQTSPKQDELSSLRPPRQSFEDVKLIRRVGEGSFGKVYYGSWSGAPVAVKVIQTANGQLQDRVGCLPSVEAGIASSLSHPNLVQTFKSATRTKTDSSDSECEAQTTPNCCKEQQIAAKKHRRAEVEVMETWIVQEWCEQGTLEKWCQNELQRMSDCGGTPCDPPFLKLALECAMEIAVAGTYLHSRGIIHGDLTANNVLLQNARCSKGFTCKVCDFGLARILDTDQHYIKTKSMGTITYMPPELFCASDGGEPFLTQKVDVYAFGILLAQLLSKQKPYSGLGAAAVVIKVVKGVRPELPEGIPETLATLYKACVNADREERPDFEGALKQLVPVSKGLRKACRTV